MKVMKIDYGNVEIGKTATKTIEIWNESYKEQLYQVQRDPITNPLDHVFHLHSYTWTLGPDEKFLCEIYYRPLVVSSRNVDYFIIIDNNGAYMKIITYGSSIGPKVISSTKRIFMNTNKNSKVKKRIKLSNDSKVAATFMFNIDEKHRIFQLDTRYGVINAYSYKYVTITFIPPKEGRYTYYLIILILYQEPIIIELYGYCYSVFIKKETIKSIPYPWMEKDGFKGYMRDTTDTLKYLPPASLSKHYFNFGQVDVDVENIIQRIPHSICLTNHIHSNLLIIWEKDTDGIFYVTPSEMILRHSFPITSSGWIPQYEIPQTVIMPPSVPPYPVYTTFLIKKFGHLPLMFQFVSPSASHFIVKPMLGVIYQDYQIIIVEMTSKPKNEQIYIERWSIYFNGNTKNENYIDFKGYAEYANLVFNNNNLLSFPSVLPGCQQFLQLGMRNVTRHEIKYEFYNLPSEFKVQFIHGKIDANDTLYQECLFAPNEINKDYDFEIQCLLIVIKNGASIGSKSFVNLRIRGSSEMGLLEAHPNKLNFDELEYNNTKTLSFDLVNPSLVDIYYTLICTHRNWELGDIKKDVKLHPLSETIFAGSTKKILVSITPHAAVYYEFIIQYVIRINFCSDILVNRYNPIDICSVSCMCILPTIKVDNLCAFGYNQDYSIHISKQFLWNRLQINKLNEILIDLLPGETETVNINLLPMTLNKGTLLLKWVIINPSTLPISLKMKKIKQCSCKPIIKTIGYLPRRIEIDCIHKNICDIYIKSKMLKPEEETVIGMNIHYILVGKTIMSWDLNIGHDRHIIFKVTIDCLAEHDSQSNFLSTPSINFGKVYFGNKQPFYRAQWIFNITNKDLPYSVDTNNIHKLNEKYQCEIFSCLSQDGIIKSGTAIPLIFKFQPRMFGEYKIIFPIIMGDKTEELTLQGQSIFDFKLVSIWRRIPAFCACKTPLFPIYFSVDSMNLWNIPMHNSVTRMLLIYNNLDFDALGYKWKCQKIPGLLSVDIFPRKGILQPSSVQSFRVRIETSGYPGRIDFHIPCMFFNASKRREYQRSIIKHNILSQELKEQFTITEKGIYVPKPWIEILDEPSKYYKTLSVRCCTYSVEDENIKVKLLRELKATPLSVIHFDDNKNYNNVINEKELYIITLILENLLWDIVNTKRFIKIIENNLIPVRNLYYTQFTMDISKRKRLARRSYISPPLKIIEAILERMSFDIIHEEFTLNVNHLIPDEDVRHRNYFKMLPKQKRTDLKFEFREDEDDEDEDIQHMKPGYRISFANTNKI
ncbi:cilia- and flagella-associated protein 65-like isoform X2 [Apis laboriosa]|uniref:cilia- and flagella-associated protein 65-like isoform X2 n=1 Tax=Apis laboriosa TaxID=183418 RepID=UPI001CC7ABC1|nr:cilia- and flagella-associated protein 65-like isoform X2 [Apis laboriosa]